METWKNIWRNKTVKPHTTKVAFFPLNVLLHT